MITRRKLLFELPEITQKKNLFCLLFAGYKCKKPGLAMKAG